MTSSRRSIARDVTILNDRDADYPERLRRLGEYAPTTLYCRGNLELLNTRSIAIIGARDSTEYGDSVAEMFASELARHGITIVSGLARGIDGIAHMSALAVRGNTIGVLGCGIDVYYPHSNMRLQERVAEEGLLISEFPPGAPAHRHHFPQRNRIIALLADAVLVVEAGPKSGTRITVNWALGYGQDVFAVPGPIGRYESQGTNEICQEGGHLVISVRDILETMHWTEPEACAAADSEMPVDVGDPLLNEVLSALDASARHIDEIGRRCRQSPADTLLHLLQLELDGLVVQHAGMRFARKL
jgi:DNA processing protein